MEVIIILTRPLLNSLIYIDSNIENTIKYNVIGGEQVFGYQLEIYDNSNNTLTYETKSFSSIYEISIPSITLTNGKEYKLRIRTFNGSVQYDYSNLTGNVSEFSDYSVLKCFTTPEVAIINFMEDTSGNNVIRNQTFEFIGYYSQLENVPLKSFRYLLYNENRILIKSFNEKYQISGNLAQEVTAFNNNTAYYIELKTINQYDIETSSGLILFYVQYIKPRIRQAVSATNDYNTASIKVEAKIIRVIFEGNNYEFEENDWVNLKNTSINLRQESNFSIDNDFTLKLWIKNITENVYFLSLIGEQGRIDLQLSKDRFHIYKGYNNVNLYSHYGSELINSYSNDTIFFIFIQQIKGMMNIKFEKVI